MNGYLSLSLSLINHLNQSLFFLSYRVIISLSLIRLVLQNLVCVLLVSEVEIGVANTCPRRVISLNIAIREVAPWLLVPP